MTYVLIDTQSGVLDRKVQDVDAAMMVGHTLPEFYFNMDYHGEAFNSRYLVVNDWRSRQYIEGKVTKQ